MQFIPLERTTKRPYRANLGRYAANACPENDKFHVSYCKINNINAREHPGSYPTVRGSRIFAF